MSFIFNLKQYKVMLKEGLRLFLTGSRGDSNGGVADDGSRHLLGAAYSLTLSTIVAAVIFQEATPRQYILVTASFSMIFTAITVVSELAGGLFHSIDLTVTGHLPISGLTRFSARFSELLVTLFILTLNLCLVPSILFYNLTEGSILGSFVFLAVHFCAAVFTAGACLVIYFILARFLTSEQFQGVLLYLNIFISLGMLGLLCNAGRLLQSGILGDAMSEQGAIYFPPMWFTGLTLNLLGLPGGGENYGIYATLALCVAVLPLLSATFGSERLLSAMGGRDGSSRSSSAPGFFMRLFESFFVSDKEKCAFEFTAVNLSRDRGFRLKAYPILGIPVLIITLSLFDRKDPLFYIFMLHLMNLYMILVLSFLPFGDWHKAGWIFQAAPVSGLSIFSLGAEKAFIFRIVLPLFVLDAAALAIVLSPLQGLLHSLYAISVGLFIVGIRMRQLSSYPFTIEFKGAISNQFMGSLFSALFVTGIMAMLQFYTMNNLPIFLLQIGVMLFLYSLRFYLMNKRMEVVT